MRTVIVVGALALGACSTTTLVPDPPAPVPRVLVDIDRARCERAIRCEPVLGENARREQREHCAAAEERHAITANRIAAGDLRIDEAAVAECFDALHAASCHVSVSPCWDVLVGARDEGEACDDDWACREGTHCAFGLECPHVCERLAPHGTPCDDTTWCEETCRIPRASSTGECQAWDDPYWPCRVDDDCWVLGECVDGHCAAIETVIGEPCEVFAWPGWCQPGQVCDVETGLCAALPGEGEPCLGLHGECAPGLTCWGRTCAPLRAAGETCSYDVQCAPGAPFCVDGSCLSNPSGNECERASDCPEDFACVHLVSMSCRARVSAGELCVADAQCLDGMRCLDGVCRAIALPGGACTSERECADAFLCDAGACVSPPHEEPCDRCAPAGTVPIGGDCAGAGAECAEGATCAMAQPDFDTYRCFRVCP